MKHIDICTGIGGFPLAASWVWGASYQPVAFCEIDAYCQAWLRSYWPAVPCVPNIYDFRGEDYAGTIDLFTAGIPCQPVSHAGQRRGTNDDRWLWPEALRLIRAIRPRWVVVENVCGLVTQQFGLVFDALLADLEGAGYAAQPLAVPATAVNAWHLRDRIWILAHANEQHGDNGRSVPGAGFEPDPAGVCGDRAVVTDADRNGRRGRDDGGAAGNDRPDSDPRSDCGNDVADAISAGWQERQSLGGSLHAQCAPVTRSDCDAPDADCVRQQQPEWEQPDIGGWAGDPRWREDWPAAATRLCSPNDGLPGEVGGTPGVSAEPPSTKTKKTSNGRQHRIRSLGNAIVPQVAEMLFRAIRYTDDVEAMSESQPNTGGYYGRVN